MISLSRLLKRLPCYSTTAYAPLPELPVPKLDWSLDKFQASIQPILREEEFSQTVRVLKEFASKDAPYLQNKLIQLSKEKTNWAEYIYVYDRFLSNRNSLIYSSPVIYLNDKLTCVSTENMLSIVSHYISKCIVMQEDIRQDRLPQDMRGNTPLCMKLYKKLLGSYRVPGVHVDKLHFTESTSRHVVVMYAGHVYKVPVFRMEKRELLSVHEIYQLLCQIVLEGEGTIGPSVSILTTLERPEWYSAREELRQSPVNATSLREIEDSLFGVCLDGTRTDNAMSALKQVTIGGKLPFNCWYDLGNQLIVTRDGYIGIVYDHTVRDGSLRFPMGDFTKYIDFNKVQLDDRIRVEKLNWELSDSTKSHIEQAQGKLTAVAEKTQIHNLIFKNFGTDFVKNQHLHPNGYIMIAVQLAYHELYNYLSPCHHTVSLRKFNGGRLEQPFNITNESKAFIEAMIASGQDENQKRFLLNRAISKQREIMEGTFNGVVTNKHMRALKVLAEEEGMDVNLFTDDGFIKVFNNKFFTTHGYSPVNNLHGFSFPKSLDGNFVLTILQNNQFNISVASIHNSLFCHSAIHFAQAIEDSLMKIKQLVEKTN